MKKLLCLTVACISACLGMAQASTNINGEIEMLSSLNVDNAFKGLDSLWQEGVWSRSKFILKFDNAFDPKAHAFASTKIYTDTTMGFHLKLNEAYIDYYAKKFDFRGGLQIVSWGTAYKINPTDVVSPDDFTEKIFFLPDEKLGILAAQTNYYPLPKLTITGVYIPYFVPAFQMQGIPLPPKTLGNSEYAFKLSARSIAGCDFSVSYFKGSDDFPNMYGQYQNMKIFGADFIGTFREIAFWAEGARTKPATGNSIYEVVAGAEYTFKNDLYLMGQFYHGDFFGISGNSGMAVLRYPSTSETHTTQLTLAYNPKNDLFIVFPELSWSLADVISLKLGFLYIKGNLTNALLGQVKNQAIFQINYSF